MELVMSSLTYDIGLVYLDDILVFSKTFEEHCDRLSTIFDRLERHTLKLKPTKCHLFQRKVKFLGHVVSEKGIECDPDKVTAISTWPVPTSVSEVRTFCRLASYYRTFVQDFAELAKPLHNMTRKNAVFEWTPECETAFQALKERLIRLHRSWCRHAMKVSTSWTLTLQIMHWELSCNRSRMGNSA